MVSSLTGQQAPLGSRNSGGPVQLRTETSRNNGAPVLRQQIVGNVDAETVYNRDGKDEEEEMEEGRNDRVQRQAAPHQRTFNGTHRRNIHLDFSPDRIEPSSRHGDIIGAYSMIGHIWRRVQQSLTGPPRTYFDIAREYHETSRLIEGATNDDQRLFYNRILQALTVELNRMMPGGGGGGGIGTANAIGGTATTAHAIGGTTTTGNTNGDSSSTENGTENANNEDVN